VFTDRKDAGLRLATTLRAYRGAADQIIGLARGGVAVAAPIAKFLHIPLAVLVVKKIGSPGNPELAIGAVVPERQTIDVQKKTVLLVDDGAATGETMRAAVAWVKNHGAEKIICALPVAPPLVAKQLRALVDDVVILETPSDFGAVGAFYKNFPQLSDEDVVKLTA
jgi:predicted phosphoribosyltransferase